MLVLKRQPTEGKDTIVIDEQTVITIQQVKGEVVTVGIDAPMDVRIRRGELPIRNHAVESVMDSVKLLIDQLKESHG